MKKNKKIILWVNSFFRWPHHDNWAFLFYWDKYIWINSERLDRIKYSSWYKIKISEKWNKFIYDYDRAYACIKYCLSYFNLTYLDIDIVVYLEWLKDYVEKIFPINTKKVWIYNHHLVHAYSSYYSSWYKESAILVMDWQWKRIEQWLDKMVLQSLYYWLGGNIKLLKETVWEWNRKIWIWTLYEMFTKLLKLTSEWTLMWLSSYWKNINSLWIKFLKKYNGHYYINDDFIKWIEWSKLKFLDRNIFLKQLWLKDFDLWLDNITEWLSADIALQIQIETENAIIDLVDEIYDLTKCSNLCIVWWVWLNSVVNSKIIKKTKFKKVFILPSCDDSWLALWCAQYWKKIISWNNNYIFNNYYFWKIYKKSEIEIIINKYKKYFSKIKYYSDNLEDIVSDLLYKWNIIWWFQWRSEAGPRALWNRSILARPNSIIIRNRVNNIKNRELWRPLTPSIISGFANNYFFLDENEEEYKYMLKVVKVKKTKKKKIEWVIHIDNTCRIQVVFKKDNPRYYKLISKFYEKSGLPILLNTSFNSSWEPIVENPEDAIKMFLSSNLDYLVLWNIVLSKNKIYSEFSFKKPMKLESILFEKWKSEIILYENSFKYR